LSSKIPSKTSFLFKITLFYDFFVIFCLSSEKSHARLAERRGWKFLFGKAKIMEDLYHSLFSSSTLLSEQFMDQMSELTWPGGPVLVYVDPQRHFYANNPNKVAFLDDEDNPLDRICSQIDDGCEPCIASVTGGTVVGTQLDTEKGHHGYFLIYLVGYAAETVHANMDAFELMLAQSQLIFQLIEKNNQLHTSTLSHLSKTSTVLSSN
jgi:hypothetical protein